MLPLLMIIKTKLGNNISFENNTPIITTDIHDISVNNSITYNDNGDDQDEGDYDYYYYIGNDNDLIMKKNKINEDKDDYDRIGYNCNNDSTINNIEAICIGTVKRIIKFSLL